MNLDERLSNCAVIGAAGKMGRGIVLVLLKEMISTDLKLKRPLSRLICIDRSSEGLSTLRDYLEVQMLKFAERNISKLREWYKDSSLVDNSEMIDQFLKQCRQIIITDSSYAFTNQCQMVFEAVFENMEIKNEVYSELKKNCPEHCMFYSNTSSIPISELNYSNELFGRLIGFHFYNPPAVQKLVEVITTEDTKSEEVELAHELIQRLNKLAVPSHDIAGFIGNGHFIREGLFYIREVDKLPYSKAASLYLINEIIQKLMFRPMGVFQLIDYVGLDVFKMICGTMGSFIEEDFTSSVLETLIDKEIKGGQFGDGSQKDGFFKYEKGKIVEVYDWEKEKYINLETVQKEISTVNFPELQEHWKSLSRSRNLDYIKSSFASFKNSENLPEKKALEYLSKSYKIAAKLHSDGVTDDLENVNKVMTNGFFHLYGPASDTVKHVVEA